MEDWATLRAWLASRSRSIILLEGLPFRYFSLTGSSRSPNVSCFTRSVQSVPLEQSRPRAPFDFGGKQYFAFGSYDAFTRASTLAEEADRKPYASASSIQVPKLQDCGMF